MMLRREQLSERGRDTWRRELDWVVQPSADQPAPFRLAHNMCTFSAPQPDTTLRPPALRSCNDIGDAGLAALIPALARLTALELLNVGSGPLPPVSRILSKALAVGTGA